MTIPGCVTRKKLSQYCKQFLWREFFGTSKVLELSHQETTKRQIKRKAVIKMENMNYEFLLSIFKELTTELPEELIYRETDDFFELRSAETV